MLNERGKKYARVCKGCGARFDARGLGRGNKGHCSDRCRFRAKVTVCGPDECWEWVGSISGGYGTYRYREKTHKAHRVAFAMETGSWPQGVVMHQCDNPRCCNPAHLKDGTHAENMLDMKLKGRGRSCPGSSSKMAKLTEADVVRILTNKMSAADVMSLFKIGSSATYSILRRRTWKHVEVA